MNEVGKIPKGFVQTKLLNKIIINVNRVKSKIASRSNEVRSAVGGVVF
jgi:hypothetical protein